MMKYYFHFKLLFVINISICGLGAAGTLLQESFESSEGTAIRESDPPDKNLYLTGIRFIEMHEHLRAELALFTLINTYPYSDYAAPSLLELGKLFLEQGGRQNQVRATLQYQRLVDLSPGHPEAQSALMKIIVINMELMNVYRDDDSYVVNAGRAIDEFLLLFPESDYIPKIKLFREEVSRQLASRRLSMIAGYVAGPESKILEDVSVSLIDRESNEVLQITRSDDQGYFAFKAVPMDKKIQLHLEKQGFMNYLSESVDSSGAPLRITLYPASIERIRIRGSEHIRTSQIYSYIGTKPGKPYSQTQLDTDIGALYRTGFFKYLDIVEQDGQKGKIITFVLEEKPIISQIEFKGNEYLAEFEIIDALKNHKVRIARGNIYDQREVETAELVLKILMNQHGKPYGTVHTEIDSVSPSSVGLRFIINENGENSR